MIMNKIILITGGERSGKSSFAEQTALSLSSNPVYMATARVWDDEFRERVRQHQLRRSPEWTNIEEELQLSKHNVSGRVVLIDCITLWCTNFFYRDQQKAENDSTWVIQCLDDIKAEFDLFTAQDATFIFVTNEIGMGGVSANTLQRRFTDLQGLVNQYIASKAHEVTLMVSGIPVKIK